jgi:hypothetical protein
MAGDWIKMRTNLDTDVRVLEIAEMLSLTELHVVGCLWKLWSWADQHTHDGNAIRVTHVTLDRFTAVTGFADALRKVGWLEGRDGALTFPRFAEHNGQTAKNRAETKERVAKHRNAKTVTDVTQKPLPEKRREEKITHSNSRHIDSEKFVSAWDAWKNKQAVNSGVMMDAMTEQAQLYQLESFDTDEAIAIVQFSLSRTNCRNLITNGDHKAKKANESSGGKPRKQMAIIGEDYKG